MAVEDVIAELESGLTPEALDNFREPEKICLARSMEMCNLESLPESSGFPQGDRASGNCICDVCGNRYIDHPMDWRVIGYGDVPFLNILCDGRRVKL